MKDSRTIVVGIGNPNRGDDAIGLIVADQIKDKVPQTVKVRKCYGDMAELIEVFEDYNTVLLVDAIQTNSKEPGYIHKFDDKIKTYSAQCLTSTHGLDLGQALELAKNLNSMPDNLLIYGIEAENFDHGAGLSSSVTATLPLLEQDLLKEIKRYRTN